MCVTAAGRAPSVTSPSRSASIPSAAATAPAPTATVCVPSATKDRAVPRVRVNRFGVPQGCMIVPQFFHETWMLGASQQTHFTHPSYSS